MESAKESHSLEFHTPESPEMQPDLHGPLGKRESQETTGVYWRAWAKATVSVPGKAGTHEGRLPMGMEAPQDT